jgi:pyrrolidone-carboxylate peptidase
MFGCDKFLKDCVRLECFAEKDGVKCETRLDVKLLSETLSRNGVENVISETPTQYLCNEAYWYALQKFEGKAVFVHMPTLKNLDENFISKMKEFKNYSLK